MCCAPWKEETELGQYGQKGRENELHTNSPYGHNNNRSNNYNNNGGIKFVKIKGFKEIP